MHSLAPAGSQPAEAGAADDAAAGPVWPKAAPVENTAIAAEETTAVPSHRLFTA